MDNKGLIQRINHLLDNFGWVRKDLAEKTGIGLSTINSWFSSRQVVPNAFQLYQVAIVLETTVEYLLTGKDKPLSAKQSPGLRKFTKWAEKLTENEIETFMVLADSWEKLKK